MTQINSKNIITVVIPAKNEEKYLPQCLSALLAEKETYGLIGEIIVVDNGSTDSTLDIAHSQPCRVLTASGNVGGARNVGAELAQTPYLAFIDADVVISSGWSQHVLQTITESDADTPADNIFTGSIYDIPTSANWLEQTWFASLSSRTTHHYINSGNLAIARKLYEDIGGFDETLISGEDVDLCERAKQHGGIMVYNPEIHAIHLGYPKTISHFFKREVWHGREMIKDITQPWTNKALMLALLHLIFSIITVIFALGDPALALRLVILYPLIPLALAAMRLERFSLTACLKLALLLSVYGFARAWSLVKSLPAVIKQT